MSRQQSTCRYLFGLFPHDDISVPLLSVIEDLAHCSSLCVPHLRHPFVLNEVFLFDRRPPFLVVACCPLELSLSLSYPQVLSLGSVASLLFFSPPQSHCSSTGDVPPSSFFLPFSYANSKDVFGGAFYFEVLIFDVRILRSKDLASLPLFTSRLRPRNPTPLFFSCIPSRMPLRTVTLP